MKNIELPTAAGAEIAEPPLYVIVARRVTTRSVPRRAARVRSFSDQVYDVHPDEDLAEITARAAELQDDARTRYGRREDTYRVAELRYVDTDRVPVIDAAHLARQRAFSERVFGPGRRTEGVIDHIRKELAEIEADPTDLGEWVDAVILALDGAWRAGHGPQEIIDAIVAKQTRNEDRTWPDWRTAPAGKAIEHDRSKDVPAVNGSKGGSGDGAE